MKVLITGASGFIAKNLAIHLQERKIDIVTFTRDDSIKTLDAKCKDVNFVFHLGGVNRPKDENEFKTGNTDLTQELCAALMRIGKKVPVLFSSSTQAAMENLYGKSKLAAEDILKQYSKESGAPVCIMRIPGVFGKWSRPNYNSVVSTFCYNIVNNLPIQISNPDARLILVYVDDLVEDFLSFMDKKNEGVHEIGVNQTYETTLGELAAQIYRFKESRETLVTEEVGTGFVRALYSTYISYFKPEHFSYPVKKYEDPRGIFVEMLKTPSAGQFSFFTAHPGITRGGHYHHTKTEKFLVIKGEARYKFRHIVTNETFEVVSKGSEPLVVETIPGWSHDITNIGPDEMVVMLWANEIFDREKPDTVSSKV